MPLEKAEMESDGRRTTPLQAVVCLEEVERKLKRSGESRCFTCSWSFPTRQLPEARTPMSQVLVRAHRKDRHATRDETRRQRPHFPAVHRHGAPGDDAHCGAKDHVADVVHVVVES